MKLAFLLLSILLYFGAGAHAQTTLIPRGALWKYRGLAGVTPGWAQSDYPDAAWDQGPAQLGYGEGDEQTEIIEYPPDAPVAVYFRKIFSVTNRSQIFSLTLRMVSDDGAVVYLNGNELRRYNLPAGVITSETEALTNVETNENGFQQFGFGGFNVREGTNTLAVEVHQHGANRLDCSFDLELLANVPVRRPTCVITNPADGTQLTAGDLRVDAVVSDAAGRVVAVDFLTNGVFFRTVNQEPFSLLWSQPPFGGYVITARAVNDFGLFTESDPVHVFVGALLSPQVARGPYLQSGSSTGLVVRWRTDWYSESVVRYGTNLNQLDYSVSKPEAVFDHEIRLQGLKPATHYYYSVGSGTQAMAAGASYYFRTAPTNASPFRMWVVGDSGTADVNQRLVRDSFYAYNGSPAADLFLMLGDNAYGGGSDFEYQQAVFNIYPELLRHTVVWPTLGNHDAEDNDGPDGNQGAPFLNIFTLPQAGECGGVASGAELYYSFDYGNAHVVCLDSFLSDRRTNGAMLTWLEHDLAATDRDWIIAFWHHPPYTWGSHDSDGEYFHIEMRERALPILEAYGVDLVLGGHSHVYERSYLLNGHYGFSSNFQASMKIDSGLGRSEDGGPYRKPSGGLGAGRGTVYVVCGCSGEGGASEGFRLHPAMALNHGEYGSMVIDVDGLRLIARFLRPSGTVDDSFTIDKSQPTSLRPRLQIHQATNGIVLSWPTSTPGYSLGVRSSLGNGDWQPFPGMTMPTGRRNVRVIGPAGDGSFFRLEENP